MSSVVAFHDTRWMSDGTYLIVRTSPYCKERAHSNDLGSLVEKML